MSITHHILQYDKDIMDNIHTDLSGSTASYQRIRTYVTIQTTLIPSRHIAIGVSSIGVGWGALDPPDFHKSLKQCTILSKAVHYF